MPKLPVTLDTKGRVRTSKEQRRLILAEFERSGVSATQFARRTGLKYSTLAGWVHRYRGRKRPGRRSAVRLLEAVVAPAPLISALKLELPGGALDYREIGVEQLLVIRPLWEKLRAYHIAVSPHFAARRSARTFDARRQELLAKSTSGRLKVDITCTDIKSAPVAYCVTSLASDGAGEIDLLFVDQDYRGKGIGTELMRRALSWLDGHKATSKTVIVAFGNDPAIEFYRRFGFLADNIALRQISDTSCRPDGPANSKHLIH